MIFITLEFKIIIQSIHNFGRDIVASVEDCVNKSLVSFEASLKFVINFLHNTFI